MRCTCVTDGLFSDATQPGVGFPCSWSLRSSRVASSGLMEWYVLVVPFATPLAVPKLPSTMHGAPATKYDTVVSNIADSAAANANWLRKAYTWAVACAKRAQPAQWQWRTLSVDPTPLVVVCDQDSRFIGVRKR